MEDGTHLHACEVERFSIPNWGPKENNVVSLAVIFMQTQGKDLRTLDPCDLEDPSSLEMFKATGSTNLYVDYSALPSMEDEKLDAFLLFYGKEVPQGERFSRQKIAHILSDAGMRIAQRKRAA